MPQLQDPNFQRAVVLMIEHSDQGSMGLVINRASPLTLKDLAEGQQMKLDASRSGEAVFLGGPVEPHRGFVLHDSEAVSEKHLVLPGLYLSLTLDTLGPLLLSDKGRIRFCLGYSGWGPRQVEQEISQGSWLFTEATSLQLLEGEPGQLWEESLKSMGVDPAMLQIGRGVN